MVTFINNVLYKTGIAQQHEELGDMSLIMFLIDCYYGYVYKQCII